MTIIIKRLHTENFSPGYQSAPDTDANFQIFALIDNNKNTTVRDIAELEIKDRDSARKAFIKLIAYANTGEPFHKTFDGKQYHAGHEFKHQNSNEKIWRLWIGGVTRIYFIYLPNRMIVVLKTLAKRKDDLNKGEKLELQAMAIKVFDCYAAKLVIIREIKNGEVNDRNLFN
jgi:mRNA-degrading endonuclease RelE of RelBE toxin-antitoxin system